MPLCVLTGDIVGSTDLDQAQMARLNDALAQARDDMAGASGVLDTFRGDGWQMSFDPTASALRHALFVRATLRARDEAFATRIALAEGKQEFDPQMTNTGVHIRSGRCLDSMPRDILMAHAAGGLRHATTVLADHISRDWSQAQARAIRPFLLARAKTTQKEVATTLGISRQAVGQALEAAGFGPLSRALTALEEQAQ